MQIGGERQRGKTQRKWGFVPGGLTAPSPRRGGKREDVETVLSAMTKERERKWGFVPGGVHEKDFVAFRKFSW